MNLPELIESKISDKLAKASSARRLLEASAATSPTEDSTDTRFIARKADVLTGLSQLDGERGRLSDTAFRRRLADLRALGRQEGEDPLFTLMSRGEALILEVTDTAEKRLKQSAGADLNTEESPSPTGCTRTCGPRLAPTVSWNRESTARSK